MGQGFSRVWAGQWADKRRVGEVAGIPERDPLAWLVVHALHVLEERKNLNVKQYAYIIYVLSIFFGYRVLNMQVYPLSSSHAS